MSLLEIEELRAGYGDTEILHGVAITVEAGELAVIIGPNGAGKSTLIKAIFGVVATHGGHVRFAGADITGAAPERLVAMGLAYVPQERNVFPTLTVAENLEMGAFRVRGSLAPMLEAQYALFPELARRRRQVVGELSGGQRQMVALARALMTKPKLLLLDEPTAGLSPKVMAEVFGHIRVINRTGIGVLMVEQNARLALDIADRGYVLAAGRNRFSGTGADLLADRQMAQAFLGG
ncbi:MAG: ABC transporter ATP-binding protein [Hyphomicrobiales bacterium]|nr:ABC transporter ATP-binding protein [Hyphomicrobiales bacterium]